jgi:hypothetical protein
MIVRNAKGLIGATTILLLFHITSSASSGAIVLTCNMLRPEFRQHTQVTATLHVNPQTKAVKMSVWSGISNTTTNSEWRIKQVSAEYYYAERVDSASPSTLVIDRTGRQIAFLPDRTAGECEMKNIKF